MAGSRLRLLTLAAAIVTTMGHQAQATDKITIMATGGAWQAALRKAWFEPFTKETGIRIAEQEHLGDLGKIKAMVDTGHVPIDLVNVETATVLQGCDEGILERVDYSRIADREKFFEGSALDCGVGLDAYGDMLAYDTTALPDGPTSVRTCSTRKSSPANGACGSCRRESRMGLDGGRRRPRRCLQGARDARRRRSRLQEARHDQKGHRLVGSRRAAAATARLARKW